MMFKKSMILAMSLAVAMMAYACDEDDASSSSSKTSAGAGSCTTEFGSFPVCYQYYEIGDLSKSEAMAKLEEDCEGTEESPKEGTYSEDDCELGDAYADGECQLEVNDEGIGTVAYVEGTVAEAEEFCTSTDVGGTWE